MEGIYLMWARSVLRDEGSGAGGGLSRRQLLGASAAVPLAMAAAGSLAGCGSDQHSSAGLMTTRRPTGVIGANINEYPGVMSFPALREVKASWVRAFFPMPDADKGAAGQPVIKALLTAAGRNYGTVLSLKFPFNNAPIPTHGTPTMAAAQRRLDAVLSAVMGKVDILVIGNEPFIECEPADRNSTRLNDFYKAMAGRAIAYRAAHRPASKTQLYMGALNHLDQPSWRMAATERWMGYVRNTAPIAGIDIHPHLPDPGAGQAYLDYVLPRMRADQKFLATEFSLVQFYKKHLGDPVAPGFARRYRMSAGTPVWQVIQDALRRPFTQKKWDDFLAESSWFAGNRNFLHDQAGAFRATGKLVVACFGFGQGAPLRPPQFGPDSTPWVLTSLFCQHTVQPASNGLPGQTTVWTNEFRSLQH
jgi:hypothetical protein